jgi:hypothetical protein
MMAFLSSSRVGADTELDQIGQIGHHLMHASEI